MEPRNPADWPALVVHFVDSQALLGRAARAAETIDAERWALADLALQLERALGADPAVRRALVRAGASPAALAAAAGLSACRLGRLRRTAEAFPAPAREAGLSFEHHAVVAARLPGDGKARRRWLKRASREGLTPSGLARLLAAEERERSPRPKGSGGRPCKTKGHEVR